MGKKVPPSVKMEQEMYTGLMTSGDPLGEAAHRSARLLLQKAIEAEDRAVPRPRLVRTLRGRRYERKTVPRGGGTIELAVPQLRDTLVPFESVWLKAIGKRSTRRLEMIPRLSVKGMSQRDLEAALVDALGVEHTGRSVIGQVCRSLRVDLERWQERDVSEYRLMYLFLDGLDLRLPSPRTRARDERLDQCNLGIHTLEYGHRGERVMAHVFDLALSLDSHYSLHGVASFVVRLWGVFAKTTSAHGSRFVNSQLMMAHLRQECIVAG